MGRFWVVSKVELAGLGVKAREGLRTSPGLGACRTGREKGGGCRRGRFGGRKTRSCLGPNELTISMSHPCGTIKETCV